MQDPKTTIDWLRFRTKSSPVEAIEALRPLFGDLGSTLDRYGLERGVLGFSDAVQIVSKGMVLGRIDFGGHSQKGWARVDIPACGCHWVPDWGAVESLIELDSAQVRRLDIALTTWDGEINHDMVVDAHARGRFITGGRPPSMQVITNTNLRAGKTCYIGNRKKSDKFFRAYEKGFQMVPSDARFQFINTMYGKRLEDIYRCELELKTENTPIPWSVIDRRDHYFAGAYPFCADILPDVVPSVLNRSPEKQAINDLSIALLNCRIQYGSTLKTALEAYHGDISAVWDLIVGDQHCQRLVEAGVLLVDHYGEDV